MRFLTIAVNTFREAVRNKVLYSILLFAFVLVVIAVILGASSLGDPTKFAKDFATMAVSLFSVVIAAVLGATLLQKELGRKTILNLLSKPVARWEFIFGKFLGLFFTLAVICGAMSLLSMLVLWGFESRPDWGLLLVACTSMLELMIVVGVALFYSSIVVTPALAGMFTAATFVAGRSSAYLVILFKNEYPPLVQTAAQVLYWALPHLDRYNINDQVVYAERIDPLYLAHLLLYALAYTGVMLLLSFAIFSRREIT